MTTFCFIRHGQDDTREAGTGIYRDQGHDMLTLSPKGIAQVNEAAKDPRLAGADLILTSPFGRAMHTAAILSKTLQVDLKVETNIHEWRADRELRWVPKTEDAEASFREMNALGGIDTPDRKYNWETADMVRARVNGVLEKYTHLKKVIVVTHGTLTQLFLGVAHPGNAEIFEYQTETPLLFTVDLQDYNPNGKRYYRPSARAIIRRGEEVALIYSRKNDYYKIPGGGIDPGEDQHTALIRETKEEAGLTVIPESIRSFGRVTRIQKGTEAEDEVFIQENFYFTCEAEEGAVAPALTEKEQAQDFVPAFATPAHAAEVNLTHPHGPDAKPAMIEREARVLELISKSPV
ncbi:MAG: histidine phosphatase family protein [Lachnospiraceae bacterium]|nr:histidine phosphatase family protein [Lachnospiraceae bacterium]